MKPAVYWLILTVAALAAAFAPLPAGRDKPASQRTFRIEARQYAYEPGELRVSPGDTVTLELVSTDVVHGLYLDGYGLSLEADPGQTKSVTFVAEKPGSFRFRCNVTCGALHPFMIGRLTVGSNTTLLRGVAVTVLGAFAALLIPRSESQTRLTL